MRRIERRGSRSIFAFYSPSRILLPAQETVKRNAKNRRRRVFSMRLKRDRGGIGRVGDIGGSESVIKPGTVLLRFNPRPGNGKNSAATLASSEHSHLTISRNRVQIG